MTTRRRCSRVIALVAFVSSVPAVSTTTAWAQTKSTPPAETSAASQAPPPPTDEHLAINPYPGTILLVDALSFGLVAVGAKNDSTAVVTAGIGGYVLGGPIVHLAHGRAKTAGASLGLRVLTPLALAALFGGVATAVGAHCRSDDEECSSPDTRGLAIIAGGFLGVVATPFLDATLLARKEWFDKLPVVPSITAHRGGGAFSVGGVF
jgi:hypothetical protein